MEYQEYVGQGVCGKVEGIYWGEGGGAEEVCGVFGAGV